MRETTIRDVVEGHEEIGRHVTVFGWVRSFRSNRFIVLNDGSTVNSLQVVVDSEKFDPKIIGDIHVASSLKVTGTLVSSIGTGQSIEVIAREISILGANFSEDLQLTVLQPKKHSFEKLREQAHLRFRTNVFAAVFRVRHAVSFAIHSFFNERFFFYINTPIITAIDAEGAGKMFRVTGFDLDAELPRNELEKVDFNSDFFGRETYLTVSGQLSGECAAMGLGRIYTFGPTFRAENSNTVRHLAEFWMVEPEMAFFDLVRTIDLVEDFLKYLIRYVLSNCKDDIEFLDHRFRQEQETKSQKDRAEYGLTERLIKILEQPFQRVSYTEAIDILKNSNHNKKGKFRFPIEGWGSDLQSEHECYLVDQHFKCPVVVYDYPTGVKAFYMRLNDDGKTVAAMDVLFPSIGEIVGGSQREERFDILKKRMADMRVDEKELWWYLDTRKFGSVPHSGFGLGLERLILFFTGMSNIRDVIPFPRTPKNADF